MKFEKIEWKDTINELPDTTREVIVYFENSEGFHTTSAVFNINKKLFYENYDTPQESPFNVGYTMVYAWCDLPVYTKAL